MFSFNHVTLSVKDLQKTINFYGKFGFKIKKEYHSEEVDIVLLSNQNMVLELFFYKDAQPLPEHSKNLGTDLRTIGNKHFGLGVKDIYVAKKFVEDENLCDGEIKITQGRLGKPYFFIKDPNDILLEIIEED